MQIRSSFATVRHDGVVSRGCVVGGDNYLGEMVAQLEAAGGTWRRAIVLVDATSPPLALRTFMQAGARRKHNILARGLLETWEARLADKEVLICVWQTSHAGAPINDWADAEASDALRDEPMDYGWDAMASCGRWASMRLPAPRGVTK